MSKPPTDAEAMQLAYKQFMMQNSSPTSTPKSTGKQSKKHQVSPHDIEDSQIRSTEKRNKQVGRRYDQIVKAFRRTLKLQWLDCDEHLEKILASVVNFRERIAMEYKALAQEQPMDHQEDSPPWEGFGYRFHHKQPVIGGLVRKDVELALAHDMIKHEKMLAGLRSQIGALSQGQDALGRRFDEVLQYHLDIMSDPNLGIVSGDYLPSWAAQVDWCEQVYTTLASELYRKQCLVKEVLDSMDDRLLVQDDLAIKDSPLKVARKCNREWSNSSNEAEQVHCRLVKKLRTLHFE